MSARRPSSQGSATLQSQSAGSPSTCAERISNLLSDGRAARRCHSVFGEGVVVYRRSSCGFEGPVVGRVPSSSGAPTRRGVMFDEEVLSLLDDGDEPMDFDWLLEAEDLGSVRPTSSSPRPSAKKTSGSPPSARASRARPAPRPDAPWSRNSSRSPSSLTIRSSSSRVVVDPSRASRLRARLRAARVDRSPHRDAPIDRRHAARNARARPGLVRRQRFEHARVDGARDDATRRDATRRDATRTRPFEKPTDV